jgi:hypothetical protein
VTGQVRTFELFTRRSTRHARLGNDSTEPLNPPSVDADLSGEPPSSRTPKEQEMTNADKYDAVLEAVEGNLSGFIGASIVDMETGMALATRSRRPEFDLDVASAYNSEMVKAKLNTMRVLNIHSGLEDMLLTLGDQLHLIKLLGTSTFVYVAVDKAGSNLALLRSAVVRETAALV